MKKAAFVASVLGFCLLAGGCQDQRNTVVCGVPSSPGGPANLDHSVAMIQASRAGPGGCEKSLRARFPAAGPGGVAYARLVRHVAWRRGDTVHYAVSLRLAEGFHRNLQGQVALLRWDNFPAHPDDADYGGVVVDGDDHRARLVLQRHGREGERLLAGPFDLPEASWFELEVIQRLSASRPVNVVSVDDEVVASSEAVNMARGRSRIDRVRYGLVAISASQARPLDLRFTGPLASLR